jgi:cell wall-associated NlpC family hydrolase
MYPVSLKILLGTIIFAVAVPPIIADTFSGIGASRVRQSRASSSGTGAAAPKKAPDAVKRAIWAANQLGSKPYRYGGGHKSFEDRGYDCSGTVS